MGFAHCLADCPCCRKSDTQTGHEDLLMDMVMGEESSMHDEISRVEQQTLLRQIAACSAREKRIALFPEVRVPLDQNTTVTGRMPDSGRGIGVPKSVGPAGVTA